MYLTDEQHRILKILVKYALLGDIRQVLRQYS
jgi:hypothetical protein